MNNAVMSQPGPTNYTSRVLGLVVALSPLALISASLTLGPVPSRMRALWGLGLMCGAASVAGLNFYLSFVRPYLFHRTHGSMTNYRHISGFPIVGTLLVCLATVVGFGAVGTAVLGLVAMALDTGGSVWFLIATWRDKSLWDA